MPACRHILLHPMRIYIRTIYLLMIFTLLVLKVFNPHKNSKVMNRGDMRYMYLCPILYLVIAIS